ncbi:Indoleamine 2,3-dioxygenase [Schizophyllum amplum]|uniref:Indoleamine 2,3-dioxygenase n=1 Tax=Schizophyllum amplum TaxID=97359 RepID=A0A550CP09_9AGAR|nr:Indoleamine 2,3-dioxygenase [Auriculariopsis ampla]
MNTLDEQAGLAHPYPAVALPLPWKMWEELLLDARGARNTEALQLGSTYTDTARRRSEAWRTRVRDVTVLPTDGLIVSNNLLRRAHVVLAYLLHFYANSLPLDALVIIPLSVGLPMLAVARALDMPPLLTMSDITSWNWTCITQGSEKHLHQDDIPTPRLPFDDLSSPAFSQLRSQTTFTNLPDECAFYMVSVRIELRGAEALRIMRSVFQELAASKANSHAQINPAITASVAAHLTRLAAVIRDQRSLLRDLRQGVDPELYFRCIVPWWRGQTPGRPWVFNGVDSSLYAAQLARLDGLSGGQSLMPAVLDAFLGVRNTTFARVRPYVPSEARRLTDYLSGVGPENGSSDSSGMPTSSFKEVITSPLRAFILKVASPELTSAYNEAVIALKEFRDAHVPIVTLYAVTQARKAAREAEKVAPDAGKAGKGNNGGAEILKIVKGARDRTAEALIHG